MKKAIALKVLVALVSFATCVGCVLATKSPFGTVGGLVIFFVGTNIFNITWRADVE